MQPNHQESKEHDRPAHTESYIKHGRKTVQEKRIGKTNDKPP